MKSLFILLLVALLGCNPESSPEGRSKIRDRDLKTQVDSLKHQNNAILDSIKSFDERLNRSESKKPGRP